MSQHQITVERPWKGIPTKQLVNIETGQTEVFVKDIFGDVKIAEAGADNKWKITDENELLKRYNIKNPKDLTGKELQKEFNNSGVKQFNNDRADVINKNSPENTKTFLATKQNPVPGTIDPKTGIEAGKTSPTEAKPEAGAVESLDTGEAVDGTGKSLKDFGNFIYPEDLGSTKQDVIRFSMLKYKPSGLKFIGKSPVSERTGTGSEIIGTVVLPIPSGISDTNACNWGENPLNAVEAGAAAAAFQGITKGIGAGVKEAGESLKKVLGDSSTKTGIAALFTANAVGTDGGAVLSRTAGIVINPNMELLFNAPTLRPFSFIFKMSARSKEEAEQIIGILNFFKRGMSPIKTKSNLFLKTPHTFRIQYLHRPEGANADHKYIGRIKECALQSVFVSYTPEGQYTTYTDGVMVSYEMQMQFQELEPIFNNDYEGLSGIGY